MARFAALSALSLSCGALATIVVKNTTLGLVQGESSNGISMFKSIPFAAPPVGPLRFRAPSPLTPWDGVLDATAAATPCAQLKLDGSIFIGAEDCLYLEVYIPEAAAASKGPLPVLVWIYGGAYILGDVSEFGWYDPTNLVTSSEYILVAGNYRLGPFGFNALHALASEDGRNSTGNAALQDQTAVLQWVQDNIAGFGGDPSRVTIFGESAGAFSVCWHLVSPASAGLFSAAVMESGTCDSPQFFTPVEDAINFNTVYASAVGCNATVLGDSPALLECLRNVSTEEMMKSVLDMFNPNWPFTGATAPVNISHKLIHEHGVPPQALGATVPFPALSPVMPWGPAIDGTSVGLLDMPLSLISRGTWNAVPLMIGTNANEGSIFVPLAPLSAPGTSFPPSDADLPIILTHLMDMYPNATLVAQQVATIMAAYPPYPLDDNWARGSDMLTHYFFACATRRASRIIASQGVPVFLYQFSHALSWLEYDFLGDYHTSELFFVWRNQWPPILHDFDANDWTMADAISAFWFNFAKTRNPNNGDFNVSMTWPQYDAALDMNMQLRVPLNVTQGLDNTLCNMWDGVIAALNAAGGPTTRRRWQHL